MPIGREDILKRSTPRPPVEVPIAEWGSVLLRYPTFAEWYSVVQPMRQLAGAEPSADLIARAVAVVLSNPDGSRMLTDHEAARLMEKEYSAVMRVWNRAWETVMKFTEADLEAAVKN
jgi:hypothetical protein